MMRMTTLVFVCATIAGCSWGGDGGSGPGGGGGVDASTGGGGGGGGGGGSPVCGDGTCASSEVNSCPADCGNGGGNTNPQPTCGNGSCETGETSASCPNDCGNGGGSGSGSGSTTCPSDPTACLFCAILGQQCPSGMDMNSCTACIGGGGGGGTGDLLCTGGAPDGTCDAMEDSTTCPSDCP